jgi:hypothetical protein
MGSVEESAVVVFGVGTKEGDHLVSLRVGIVRVGVNVGVREERVYWRRIGRGWVVGRGKNGKIVGEGLHVSTDAIKRDCVRVRSREFLDDDVEGLLSACFLNSDVIHVTVTSPHPMTNNPRFTPPYSPSSPPSSQSPFRFISSVN